MLLPWYTSLMIRSPVKLPNVGKFQKIVHQITLLGCFALSPFVRVVTTAPLLIAKVPFFDVCQLIVAFGSPSQESYFSPFPFQIVDRPTHEKHWYRFLVAAATSLPTASHVSHLQPPPTTKETIVHQRAKGFVNRCEDLFLIPQ